MLRVLCCDLMGVVLYDPYVEALEAATGLDVAAAHRLKDPDVWPAFEVAAIGEREFARRFFASPGAAFDLDAFHRARRSGYRLLPGMGELLDELDGALERHVASNYPMWIEELRVDFSLDRRFEGVWASHHLGVRKPDPVFFERLLDRVGHEPDACLFTDDREVNCAAARAAGMRAHLFDGVAGLRRRLRAEGVALGP
ncbi:MAG: HAD-IA family hydrolase [Actinomycetota bacterium]|nr:HAD-IA family hydrolase [Actinomycetota bacterium]